MKISLAQIRSQKGDFESNIENHKKFIEIAVIHGADVIVFPELSLTNYEPTLAKELAISINDHKLDIFQYLSDHKKISILLGCPIRLADQVVISTVIFKPQQVREIYSKKYLHPDEEEFFSRGNNGPGLEPKIALALCYELSVPEHAERAYQYGANIYIASVAKIAQGIENATIRLSEIAKKYSMLTFMSNCVGEFDGCFSGGQSSVWNDKGILLGHLDNENQGLLIFDLKSHQMVKIIL